MSNKVSTIWEEAVIDGDQIRVGIFSSFARILVDEFDIHVHGKFCGCDDVIAAFKRQQVEIDKAIANLPDDWEKSSCGEDNCGLIPISDEELDAEIREYDKHRGQVLNIKTRQ